MPELALALGGNVGDAAATLRSSAGDLVRDLDLASHELSPLYLTAPWGLRDQPSFVNAVLVGSTGRPPLEILDICRAIEKRYGRERRVKWGPRSLDVDILYYADMTWSDDQLVLPHPLMLQRAFVLIPLLAVRKEAVVGGVKCSEALRELDPQPGDVVQLHDALS